MKSKDRPAQWWDYALTLFVFLVLCAILWISQHPNALTFVSQSQKLEPVLSMSVALCNQLERGRSCPFASLSN